ncbi:hypothetical protein ACLB2K_042056 [Fragaria x ananassa]
MRGFAFKHLCFQSKSQSQLIGASESLKRFQSTVALLSFRSLFSLCPSFSLTFQFFREACADRARFDGSRVGSDLFGYQRYHDWSIDRFLLLCIIEFKFGLILGGFGLWAVFITGVVAVYGGADNDWF